MKILAIDSSSMPASAAVLEDGTLLAEYTVCYKKTHSQTLLPMLDQIRSMLELDLSSLDAVAVAAGPGSFTGLRIGSATAKGIALAQNRPIVSVPTLEGLACNLWGSADLICPMLDARNKQVFAAVYTFAGDDQEDPLTVRMKQTPVDVKTLCGKLNELSDVLGRKVVLLGDGASAYKDLIRENLSAPHAFAPPHLSGQRASSVAFRGMQLYRMGKAQDGSMHRPEYLRVSQAERVRAEKAEKSREGM